MPADHGTRAQRLPDAGRGAEQAQGAPAGKKPHLHPRPCPRRARSDGPRSRAGRGPFQTSGPRGGRVSLAPSPASPRRGATAGPSPGSQALGTNRDESRQVLQNVSVPTLRYSALVITHLPDQTRGRAGGSGGLDSTDTPRTRAQWRRERGGARPTGTPGAGSPTRGTLLSGGTCWRDATGPASPSREGRQVLRPGEPRVPRPLTENEARPGQGAPWAEAPSQKANGRWFESQSGRAPGLCARAPVGARAGGRGPHGLPPPPASPSPAGPRKHVKAP